MVAAGHDLAHQRRVLGRDVLADELGHVREAHDPVVEVDPLVHPAELDVADDVVEGLEQPPRRAVRAHVRRAADDVAGQVGPGVAGAVDEGVPGFAVGGDGRDPHRAVLVGEVMRLVDDRRALRPRVGDAAVDVGHLQGDVDDAVAVAAVVVEQCAARVTPPLTTKRTAPERRT